MTDVAKRVGGDLHLLAVVFNRQIALSHRVEFMTQVDGAGSLVRLKVIFVDETTTQTSVVKIDLLSQMSLTLLSLLVLVLGMTPQILAARVIASLP